MTRTLTYSGFVIASALIIFGFVTAQTYSQLAVAVVLYPALIFTAFGIFPRISWRSRKIAIPKPLKLNHRDETPKPKMETAYVADIDKRAFIKLIGATGISFFLFSLLGRRVENLIFGRTGESGVTPFQSTNGNQFGLAGPSLTDGYKIADIAEGAITYYGFINKDGGWLIMRHDTNDNSFRYAKDGSDFPGNWANRENLKYDYFYNLF